MLSQSELNSALNYAVRKGSIDIVRTLQQCGARLTYLTFQDAIERGNVALFATFMDYGWNIDSTEFEYPAVANTVSHPDLLRWLLEKGANPNTRSTRALGSCGPKITPLSCAALEPETLGLEILLEYGASMDNEALFHAIDRHMSGTIAHLKILLDHGADINHWTRRWGAPLHFAVRCNTEDKLKYLLDRGADPTIRDLVGRTPAEVALADGKHNLYEILRRLPDAKGICGVVT
ncbi:ankyrin repeat-containing domain protein [Lophiotrema nucula]|uniref:Ankyrin repeat-containing domain protein n=1 Tax=Lophiotrema nucula TaxID=690887 RepID=A0A6A5ZPF1_9PLEO|nr:ankyrin repeat-containing domain protein [Lophiotrema nucula]